MVGGSRPEPPPVYIDRHLCPTDLSSPSTDPATKAGSVILGRGSSSVNDSTQVRSRFADRSGKHKHGPIIGSRSPF